jgi:HAD superfamily phosphoserine phosphatase-like hydrolase
MPQPQIFISSTYVDLKDVRESLSSFIDQYGFEPILFEKGGIPFNYNTENEKDCYDAVKKSDLFILIIGKRYGKISSEEKKYKHSRMAKYNSITKKEYQTAMESNLPMHIFIDDKVNTEYNKWKKNKKKRNFIKLKYVDNENLFFLINDIYNSNSRTQVRKFSNISDITNWLKQQWAGHFQNFLRSQKEKIILEHKPLVKVNFYKLFYYRHRFEADIEKFIKKIDISINKYISYEKPNRKRKNCESKFPFADEIDIENIAKELGLHKKDLMLGKEDDFSYQYYEYYRLYKKDRNNKRPIGINNTLITKAIVFDFDGTLTHRNNTDNLSIWEKLWIESGYTVNDCSKLHSQYSKNEISHQSWCDKTCEAFRQGKLYKHKVDALSSQISLLPDTINVIKYLKSKGLTIHLLSGSIDVVIDNVFRDNVGLFSSIRSNGMRFDTEGLICEIVGTKYDFKEKSSYLKEIIKQYNLEPFEILYVGNSMNDRFAYLSGARTLCINPNFTNPNDTTIWTYCIKKVDILESIFSIIFQDKSDYADYSSINTI